MNEVVGNVTFGNAGWGDDQDDHAFWAFLIVTVVLLVVWDNTVGKKK